MADKPRKLKKSKSRLEARQKDYDRLPSTIVKGFTRPGSNTK